MNNEYWLSQIDAVLDGFGLMQQQSGHKDLSDLSKNERQALVTRAIAAIHRISGRDSTYAAEVQRVIETLPEVHAHLTSVLVVLQALRADVESGFTSSLAELIHGELFGDWLEMAAHLLESRYKDPAAVMAGSALEAHLKQLAGKHDVDIKSADGRPKKAALLNDELKAKTAYSPLDHKNVTAWLGLRNSAAHGEYEAYTRDQVQNLIDGVRHFITRVPA
jgi:hypothetical protein